MDIKPSFEFIYRADSKICRADRTECRDFEIKFEKNSDVISLTLLPKKSISFDKFEIALPFDFKSGDRIFPNGYQSWTISREYSLHEKMDDFNPRIFSVEKKKFNPLGIWGAGDLTFHRYPEENGVFYGYSYAYVRSGENITLFGSLSERSGYTIITFETKKSAVKIEKDLEGVQFEPNTEYPLLSLAIIEDEYETAFDRYFDLQKSKKPTARGLTGYTTWYNYYTNINENIVMRDLEALASLEKKVDIFQIDDGWETAVGDWLDPNENKFPSDMKFLADSIHIREMKAGLWLAPFAAVKRSKLFKQHKDWFVRNKNGDLRFASQNWGGFFALDIYNPQVREYLKTVFDTVLNVWGFDLVKLDFLYACCVHPIHGKSRGEIMCDAMDLLRGYCGDKLILGCGVPLAPSFGKVDYCRIGPDVALDWKKQPFSREDVSTRNAVLNSVFRRHLDGRAFLNDPDVFFLRDDNIKLSPVQRALTAKLNSITGSILFVSDNVADYSAEQMKLYNQTVSHGKITVLSASLCCGRELTIEYKQDGEIKKLSLDVSTGELLL
ncbi:MAG: alpha-galactosidase [Clostridiales bacterium]|nr:alpha-galactosidase [Clostridiales bacterium]